MIKSEPIVATDDHAYFKTSNQPKGASASRPLSKLGPRLAAVGLVGSEDSPSASASRIASVDLCEVISA